MATQATLDLVQTLYVAYYGRPADSNGLQNWADQIEANGVDAVINAFGTSPEFDARFGSLSNSELVNNLYQQLFARDAEPAGLELYTGLLDSGEQTLAEIALTIAQGARNDDLTALDNKVAVAKQFTDAIDTEAEVQAYRGNDAADAARDFLNTVDASTDVETVDVDAELAELVANSEQQVPGDDFTLTADADDLTGTANDDEFSAGLSAAGVEALQTFDRVDAGEGTDTLNATLTGNDDFANGELATAVTNVENFYLRNLDAETVDFDTITTVEQVWADRVLNDLTVTGVENVVTLGAIEGEDSALNTKSIFNVTYAADVVGDNVDSQGRFTQAFALDNANIALDVNEGTDGEATSATYTFALTGDSEVELQGSGNGLTDVLDTITTSGEGSIDLDLGALTGDLEVTLGAGDDTLRLNGTDLNANDDIDLGEGSNTLVMSGFDGADGAGGVALSSLNLDGVANADALGFADAYETNAADTLDLGDRDAVTFESTVDGTAGGEVLTVDTTASSLEMNFEGAVGTTVNAPGLEVNESVTSLTLNVGTAQAGADLTLASLTNSADASNSNSTESLETLTLVDVRGNNEEAQAHSITLGDGVNAAELNGLTTIDLSAAGQQQADYATAQGNTDSVAIVATDAGFTGPVTIKVGEAELDYDNDSGNLRETFQFVGDEISNTTIGTDGAAEFTVTAAGNGDKLDFSQFAGIDGIEDLAINSANGGADWAVSAADGQFEGTITLAGIGDVEQSTLEANAFIF